VKTRVIEQRQPAQVLQQTTNGHSNFAEEVTLVLCFDAGFLLGSEYGHPPGSMENAIGPLAPRPQGRARPAWIVSALVFVSIPKPNL
jgi:hypothetical protein